ncbi:hypothetical protein MPL3356_390154 [Mesorhizobium plurifarium]|uniref:Peptidase S49 domain-containing protein n=1 Tax=Mesorhizobium plurifarium TaxID=69974 RepID=A0A090DYC8_MESPL|nr:hypothetical protein MPL3356_390154 [Mesorhizobium plurifarium]
MSHLLHIADRVLNRPLLITPDKAQVVMSALAGRIGINSPEASQFEGTTTPVDKSGKAKTRPYRISNGVGIITITGSLVNRGAWVGASSGLTSYEGIQHQVKTALADDAVKSVILDMHTPGGEAVGAFETANLVRQLAAKKRTVAVVNGLAASAGYAIASGASEIVTTETGVSGSIGVVLLHADYSQALAKEGINPTLIFAGDHKVDGNPFEALSDEVKADLQAEVNSFYDLFVKTVGMGRGGRLTAAGARQTQARTFIGQAAVDAGLADRVGTFESALGVLTSGAFSAPVATVAGPVLAASSAAQDVTGTGFHLGYAEGLKHGKAAYEERLAEISRLCVGPFANCLPVAIAMAIEFPVIEAKRCVELTSKHFVQTRVGFGGAGDSLERQRQQLGDDSDPLARAWRH